MQSKIHKKRDGLLLVAPNGACRFLTFREALVYRLLGWMPKQENSDA